MRASVVARQKKQARKEFIKTILTVVAIIPVLWAIAILYLI